MNTPATPDHRTPHLCKIIGGPLNGEMHADRGESFRLESQDGTQMEYQRHTLASPVGQDRAIYIYAPTGWTPEQINKALGTQRIADAAMRLSNSLQEMTASAQDMAQSLQRASALLKQQKTDKHTPL